LSFPGSLELFFHVSIEFTAGVHNVEPSLNRHGTINVGLFFRVEPNVNQAPSLSVDVKPVHERERVNIFVFDTEEVTIKKVLITAHERTEKTRELAKHKLLDPDVFDDVDVGARAARNLLGRLMPTFGRRMKSVANLMTNEKIVEIVPDFLPVRKAKDTLLYVKERGVMVGLFDRDILASEKTGEDRLFGNCCHVMFLSRTVYTGLSKMSIEKCRLF
jgi:hypothetical protein